LDLQEAKIDSGYTVTKKRPWSPTAALLPPIHRLTRRSRFLGRACLPLVAFRPLSIMGYCTLPSRLNIDGGSSAEACARVVFNSMKKETRRWARFRESEEKML
jgi:hypothetical protein